MIDTSKTAEIIWFLLVLHWAVDVMYDFDTVNSPSNLSYSKECY